eukprot:403332328
MHNMAEMCFQHVFKRKNMPEIGSKELTKNQQQMIDECMDKYVQSLKIVQHAIQSDFDLNNLNDGGNANSQNNQAHEE